MARYDTNATIRKPYRYDTNASIYDTNATIRNSPKKLKDRTNEESSIPNRQSRNH